ncbi:DUF2339 domain-containing protein [Enterovirga rhinocerotis]|uniref:Putative membrane protein n=1 Tax=Enterovirga rhinocerotis TaxID=1339210 RepID=A0A4R7CB73_9HYPH|nr:DUF2339 domain-containing protein [Enterovirga rhinocerotis]TDR94316.1 putative membrane protein [Enterovirga rhinocerotis]
METVLLLLCLIAIVGLHRRNSGFASRIDKLEQRVRALSAPVEPGPAPVSSAPDIREEAAPPLAPPPEVTATDETQERLAPSVVPPVALPPASPLPASSPRPSRGFEENLGSRWAVWVGGVALALGGIFLVRYSIEQGLIGPGVRVLLGLAFAAGLIAGGEWLRRREQPLDVAAFGNANIPAILTAAGTSTAFASIYAAYGLYGLIGPTLAFVALGLVAAVTMGAAILHGPALAGLGLVAALVCPLLVQTTDPSPVALVLYLAFATGTSYAVSRLRLWRWLAVSTAVGAILWGFGLLVGGDAWLAALVTHVLVQLVLALLFLVVDPHRTEAPEEAVIDRLATVPVFFFAILAVFATASFGTGLERPLFIAAVVLLMTVSACRYPAGAGGALAGGLASVGMLAIWPVVSQAWSEPERFVRDLAVSPAPEALTSFVTAAVLVGAIVPLLSLLRLGFGHRLRMGPAAWYTAALTLTPLGVLIVAYWRVTYFDHSIPFAVVAGAMGLGFAAATAWLRGKDPDLDSPAIRLAVGGAASAAIAALAAGLTFAFDRGILTVTLALAALGTAYVAERVKVPALRWMVGALGIAVAGRFAWDPSIMRGEIGTTPIVNWLLWGYGVPAAAFLLASRILAREGRDWVVRFVESLGFVFAALLVFLQMRHALNGGDPFAPTTSHMEAGLAVTQALAFSLLMVRLDLSRPDTLYRYASLLFGGLAILGSAVVLGVFENPFLGGGRVIGGPVFNSLIPAYLVPAAMAAALAWAARLNRPRAFVLAAAALALILELTYSSLAVRRLFHPGGRIDLFRSMSDAELWCHSLVLLANGLVLLAIGILWRLREARLAALVCLVLAVLKVFLVDLSALQGLTRALSFVGLGLALMAIGFVYQRFVAPSGAARPPDPAP